MVSWQEILRSFAPNPTKLAMQYATEGALALSEFEQDRIWAEGTMETVRLLMQHVSPTDPILQKLADRWKFSLTPDQILL